MRPAVRVERLGKRFRHTLPRRRTLIGRFVGWARGEAEPEPVWALRGVSFDVEPGGFLGVCGPNGAGKSTLLRLLAGILEPTEGSVRIDGPAGTFFSLSAGLLPELSVRDNVEACGILMGLRRAEVLRRMGRILDFAELGHLAEVRLAELSSGQAARVAFSAAVYSDLRILLVDELLAVGDEGFRAKCLETFARLRREGRTVLAASHDLAAIEGLLSARLRLEPGGGARHEVLAPAREGARG